MAKSYINDLLVVTWYHDTLLIQPTFDYVGPAPFVGVALPHLGLLPHLTSTCIGQMGYHPYLGNYDK